MKETYTIGSTEKVGTSGCGMFRKEMSLDKGSKEGRDGDGDDIRGEGMAFEMKERQSGVRGGNKMDQRQ